MRNFSLLLVVILVFSCKKQSKSIQLKFLDEFILPDSLYVDDTLVGGLSGIDYQNNTYYLVCDDSKNPRFYTAQINFKYKSISNIDLKEIVRINDTTHYYDLESILIDEGQILLTSEGLIREEKDPAFISTNLSGEVLDRFQLPEYYRANSLQKPRTNGVFEGLTKNFDRKGYWIITELPLEADGSAPTPEKANSPVRMTYFDKESRNSKKQFVYELDKIAKVPLGDFAVNGVTDLLAYAPNKFLVIERSFSSGHGTNGNAIKIYDVDISNGTNTLDVLSLKNAEYIPVKKELLFDFESVRDQLTNKMIDNVEGICFGPKLSDGNQSLLLVVDNDFNKQGNRLNQFILMEMVIN